MATGSMSKGPGKSYREGLSLDRLFRVFPTDEAAEAWFTAERWPDGPYCPHCGSRNIQCGIAQGGDGGRHRHRHHARGSPACRRVRREDRIR